MPETAVDTPASALSETRPALQDKLPTAPLMPGPELDPAAVAELRRVFNPEEFDSFLADALDDIPQRVVRLTERLAAEDLPAATQEAHDLVSLFGNLGGRRASALARLVEQTCRGGDRASALARYHEFAVATAAALAELVVQRQLVE